MNIIRISKNNPKLCDQCLGITQAELTIDVPKGLTHLSLNLCKLHARELQTKVSLYLKRRPH